MSTEPAAIPAAPCPFTLHPATTALVIIDMQRDVEEAAERMAASAPATERPAPAAPVPA